MKKFLLSSSVLSANFSRLGEDIFDVLKSGSDMIHYDVMDNHYVKNLTFGPIVLESLRSVEKIKSMVIDVHLMTCPVDDLIIKFAKLDVNIISFHPESTNNVEKTIKLIKSYGCKVGLALNPLTPLCVLDNVLDKIDLILLMSVNPGFPGQKFIPSILNKIRIVRELIDKSKKNILLEVDGGINLSNIFKIASFGTDIFVIGSAIFNSINYDLTIRSFRDVLKNINCKK
ncbi:ribulose-phosphate 3-epimerase [Buchnera aphidicola str. Bp (Baizongia pistaciae)]|uniref:Ribulose-phosphate 3-epimerase n=1 Tax=Buchnera aphidicola subsp. Baizongia pistaciae (strain Bp) TaxID=224915 RepID=RPE_BUCBP|nr:ribulose-phosphate 3-epimerase [Buchnera aphidicola]Q89A59.1 RecName: Full=Ribulose-phosphate 3-epimerase [Buchnera aphidicola str. Bp (Baizongia pistaciae)]AAO27185.1 ribulose-phosphate 3-epimerase [Buchnera aphidicola str. Bp (Baizongia pistaciae)]